ncbi:hypothetical protein N9O57_01325 [bacterium]|nr:hypothetical protein [bacterium]
MEENFRVIQDDVQIISKLVHFQKHRIPITVWTNIDGEKKVVKSLISQIFIEERFFCIRPLMQMDEFTFAPDAKLFIYEEVTSEVFKSNIRFSSNKIIHLHFPLGIHTPDQRRDPRVLINGLISIESAKRSFVDILPFDLSKNGISFLLKEEEYTKNIIKEVFELKKTSFLLSQNKRIFKALYAIKHSKGLYKVGCKFINPIDDLEFAEIYITNATI